MAELDYAYLADYAQIDGGKISALGASYTHAIVPELPFGWMTSVVGRIRVAEDEEPVSVRIEAAPPGGAIRLNVESVVQRTPEMRPYCGKAGLLFAATFQITLTAAGLCTFDVVINGEHARRLAFEVEVIEEP